MTEAQDEQDRINEYLAAIQEQVVGIINSVKQDMGIDTPIEIEVVEVDSNE